MSWQTIVKENKIDVSVVNFKNLERERIDADFYSLSYIDNEKKIKELSTKLLNEVCVIKSGTTPKDREDDLTQGVILLKTTDIRNKPLSYGENYYLISEEIDQRMKSTRLQDADVLMNIVGASLDVIGRVAIVPKDFSKANITQAMALIRPKDDNFLPSYIFTFLLGKYGNLQVKRLARPTGQYNLNLQEVSAIRIPSAGRALQLDIEKLISKYQVLSEKYEREYKEAEQMLLREINLERYNGTEEAISVRNFSDVLSNGRFDAEYWQPKYDEIEKKVAAVPQERLGDIVSVKKGLEVGSEAYVEEGKNFIRVSDFTIYGIEDTEKKISQELYDSLKDTYKPKKGEVLFTKDGTIGISFAINEEVDAIVSGAFLRMSPKININNIYLALVINSFYCKAQIERMSGGAIIAHLKPESAMQIRIPMLPKVKQEELAGKVMEALKLRKESESLLEKAKRAVEIFVEKGEKEALEFLM